ncbi:HAMP domain-containing sensor histidine kinase [Oscillatoria sp. CS-180]|uniref:sensor histidine kinase n=1 Tax=Oscillatoria sp. CS-180 TaxID=3021720 RepID=UPI00232EB148|nr:HAMP domain-containing sensor histidine kinase [Oscillatoria sp. CS-180]MDB9526702.1 HAMP domain-containing sensor histidine kinase [Oscillatoria sp. CS-180]
MAIATGLTLLFGTAIAGLGTGWFLRGTYGLSRASQLARSETELKTVGCDSESKLAIGAEATGCLSHEHQFLLQQAPIGYLEVDDENQLLWINALACQVLGISSEIPASDPEKPRLLLELVRSFELDQLIENTRQAQTVCQQDWTLNLVSSDPINPDEGVACPLRGHGIPLPNHHVGIFLENRQEAETLMQQRDRWTSDVAHELKTPLTSIRLVAETLKERVEPGAKRWLDRLLNEILRLSNLVEDLLNLSRLERRGGTGLTFKPVELPRLILAAWQSLEPLADIKQIQIAYEGPAELIVLLDETLMHRVFINLIDNAIKYSPREGTIFVHTEIESLETAEIGLHNSHLLRVGVVDEGTGFRENDLPYIFNRFYRADPSRSRLPDSSRSHPPEPDRQSSEMRSNGTGLGLAIAQQIVEAHGGHIQAHNHPETGGGWLTISITTRSLSFEEAAASKDVTSKTPTS